MTSRYLYSKLLQIWIVGSFEALFYKPLGFQRYLVFLVHFGIWTLLYYEFRLVRSWLVGAGSDLEDLVRQRQLCVAVLGDGIKPMSRKKGGHFRGTHDEFFRG